ncbi:EAL domain-containing protein [Rhodovastum atsumiense]|uniref:EAL domain-containing protein n=1 Tax=Rhodovastum atsumiense TaxID=504468 RepID=A0A5M6ILN0_9PROT|nr:EAL domain-containing protein [Rhodovastum atsumiense]KAA5609176.1 EAL domain-containing protein [Rhodovastum atsumiense]CAH2602838.1 EAL domain-containing protein [Rhodovastum atsumiense]
MFIDRLSIRSKLAFAFAALVLILAVTDGMAIRASMALRDHTVEIVDNWMPSTMQLGRLAEGIARLRRNQGSAMIAHLHRIGGGGGNVSGARGPEARRQIDAAWNGYRPLVSQGEEQRLADDIGGQLQRFLDMDAAFRGLLAAGETERAIAFEAGDLRETYLRLQDAVHADQDFNRAMAVQLGRQARAIGRDVLWRTGTATALGVLTALLAAMWLNRTVTARIVRLSRIMRQLGRGDCAFDLPCVTRADEIGDMARGIELCRENILARREGEAALRRTNLQFDAALGSMLQGLVVWDRELRLQLANVRFFEITGLPADALAPGMSVEAVCAAGLRHGFHPDEDPDAACARYRALLASRHPHQHEAELRPGLLVKLFFQPMADGGCVVTLEDITERRHNEQQIIHMARHDALTGLANRAMFHDCVEEALGHGPGAGFAVFCLDLDHFKDVNDTLGHAVGDGLLRQVAERLRHCLRGHDPVARLGGDEFAVLVGELEAPEAAIALAGRIIERVGAPYEVDGHPVVIGASIGIALAGPDTRPGDLLKRADVALDKAKEERGSACVFVPGMDEHLQLRRGLEADLRAAVQAREFELFYQPLFSLARNRVTGFEALLRWRSPRRGMVSPAEFIPLAEQTGLIVPIGEWVLRTACAEAAGWPEEVKVAVNLSPVQFRSRGLVETVREALQESGLAPARLELEITETVLLQETETVMSLLTRLHELGVSIAMDDFGTGYSSLSYLRRFPFDKIKIDQSFIRELQAPPAGAPAEPPGCAAVIVRAIVGLGESLGIQTIAEGVETAAQLAQLRQEGCTEVQGYFISPPRPAAEVGALLARLNPPGSGVAREREEA